MNQAREGLLGATCRRNKCLLATLLCAFFALTVAGCELDCSEVSRVQYEYGNSSGPCTDAILVVDEGGSVSYQYNMLNQIGESMGAECPDETSVETTVPVEDARELLRTLCRAFKEGSEPGSGCEGGWGTISFYDNDGEVFDEGETGCRDNWSDGATAVSDFTSSLR